MYGCPINPHVGIYWNKISHQFGLFAATLSPLPCPSSSSSPYPQTTPTCHPLTPTTYPNLKDNFVFSISHYSSRYSKVQKYTSGSPFSLSLSPLRSRNRSPLMRFPLPLQRPCYIGKLRLQTTDFSSLDRPQKTRVNYAERLELSLIYLSDASASICCFD